MVAAKINPSDDNYNSTIALAQCVQALGNSRCPEYPGLINDFYSACATTTVSAKRFNASLWTPTVFASKCASSIASCSLTHARAQRLCSKATGKNACPGSPGTSLPYVPGCVADSLDSCGFNDFRWMRSGLAKNCTLKADPCSLSMESVKRKCAKAIASATCKRARGLVDSYIAACVSSTLTKCVFSQSAWSAKEFAKVCAM